MTVFCPLTITGAGELVAHTAGEARFVVDCKVNPAALVGQVKITLALEGMIVNCGGLTGNDRPNTVPLPELPPPYAIPYKVLPDNNKPAKGSAPSLPPVKRGGS